ncbi:MAG: hypothetical protein H5T45_05555 [Thermoplasmatales archaeon]|nr:hypothetical protein [Thermoplasmatales archaeon]
MVIKTFRDIVDRQKSIEKLEEMKEYIEKRIQELQESKTSKKEVKTREVVRSITYQLEKVKCGKEGCTKCPHGPYWYAYWREGEKVKSKYIGKKLGKEKIIPVQPPND